MAITDLQISDTLETSAPSIKYTGNEGPQAPQQMASYGYDDAMAESRQAYDQGLKDGTVPFDMEFEEYLELMQDSKQAPQQDSGIMQAAYGGMMRQKYGLGKFVRKLIPNEIARAAEVAAPFVAMAAPQFALPAALAGGLGTYDRTGKLGGALKSGALTYGLGALSPGLPGVRNIGPQSGMFTTQPFGGAYNLRTGTKTQGIRDLNPFKKVVPSNTGIDETINVKEVISGNLGNADLDTQAAITDKLVKAKKLTEDPSKISSVIKSLTDTTAKKIILGAMAGTGLYTAYTQGKAEIADLAQVARGEGLDIDGIRKEVQEALAGGEEAWAILQQKYPYVGEFPTKKAEGGRIGLYAGGVPSPYSMEDARKTSMQDKMGGITDVMKRADLFRSGDVGQMYMAEGGRIGYKEGTKKIKSWPRGLQNLKYLMSELIAGKGTDWRTGSEWYDKLSDEKIRDIIGGKTGKIYARDKDYLPKVLYDEPEEGRGYYLKADGGRIGYQDGTKPEKYIKKHSRTNKSVIRKKPSYKTELNPEYTEWKKKKIDEIRYGKGRKLPGYKNRANTVPIVFAEGGRIGAEEGGIMDLGGMEKDYRNDGGFVPIGEYEKKDDVPARLSKNEFVFTADAVRGAGGGDIDKGAEMMENMMKHLEQGGQISEDSQGLAGAQEMFDVSERIGEVI